MFTNISWGSYLTGLAALLALYYTYVAIRYYSSDIKRLLSGKTKEPTGPSPAVAFQETDPEIELHEKAEQFTAEIKNAVAEAHEQGMDNESTLSLLEPIFTRFDVLKYSPYRSALLELVVSEFGKHGSVILSEEDLDDLWIKVA